MITHPWPKFSWSEVSYIFCRFCLWLESKQSCRTAWYFLFTQTTKNGLFNVLIVFGNLKCWFSKKNDWYLLPTIFHPHWYNSVIFRAPLWYIGCDSHPRHCSRDDIPAWPPNKISLLSLLTLDLTMYHRFISFLRVVQSRQGRLFNPTYCL